jgi:hypothetical protein
MFESGKWQKVSRIISSPGQPGQKVKPYVAPSTTITIWACWSLAEISIRIEADGVSELLRLDLLDIFYPPDTRNTVRKYPFPLPSYFQLTTI